MHQQVTVVLRRPEQIRQGLDAARMLSGEKRKPNVVFLCPGCASGLDCRSGDAAVGERLPRCYTDRFGDCIPRGFCGTDAARIARLIRESDFVVPL